MRTQKDARNVVGAAWPFIAKQSRSVLGSELFYQALIYHCLREYGGVAHRQIGTNVKQYIGFPVSRVGRKESKRGKPGYKGFEPTPDIVLFGPSIKGDWRRRNREQTLRNMLLAMEVKASERDGGRLGRAEIRRDIEKIDALREEVRNLGKSFYPVVMVIDTAREPHERMTADGLQEIRDLAQQYRVALCYSSQTDEFIDWR